MVPFLNVIHSMDKSFQLVGIGRGEVAAVAAKKNPF